MSKNARASYHYPDGRTTILPTAGLNIPATEVTVAKWFANRRYDNCFRRAEAASGAFTRCASGSYCGVDNEAGRE